MLRLGIKGSFKFLHHASGRCGGTKIGLCLGHTLALIRPCSSRVSFLRGVVIARILSFSVLCFLFCLSSYCVLCPNVAGVSGFSPFSLPCLVSHISLS